MGIALVAYPASYIIVISHYKLFMMEACRNALNEFTK